MTQLLAGITVGIILFHTGANAPSIFKTLQAEDAGKLLRTLFPKFFKWLAALGVATTVALVVGGDAGAMHLTASSLTVALPLLCLALIPATNRAKDEGDSATFKRLHTVSVVLTLIVLAANLALPFI